MRHRIRDNLSILLLAVIVVIVLWFVLSRLRFVVFIPISLWGMMLLILGSIVILFLVFDHFLDGFIEFYLGFPSDIGLDFVYLWTTLLHILKTFFVGLLLDALHLIGGEQMRQLPALEGGFAFPRDHFRSGLAGCIAHSPLS